MYSAGTLSKLHLQNLPILGGDNPTAGEVAMHTLMLERWAAAHNLKAYIMGPLPDDPDATLTRDGLRILMSSVSSGSLRGALCDIDTTSATHPLLGSTLLTTGWQVKQEVRHYGSVQRTCNTTSRNL